MCHNLALHCVVLLVSIHHSWFRIEWPHASETERLPVYLLLRALYMQTGFPDGGSIFQQDLALVRLPKCKESIPRKPMKVLKWLGNLPDLNLIENLWPIIKHRMKSKDCSNLTKLRGLYCHLVPWGGNQKTLPKLSLFQGFSNFFVLRPCFEKNISMRPHYGHIRVNEIKKFFFSANHKWNVGLLRL